MSEEIKLQDIIRRSQEGGYFDFIYHGLRADTKYTVAMAEGEEEYDVYEALERAIEEGNVYLVQGFMKDSKIDPNEKVYETLKFIIIWKNMQMFKAIYTNPRTKIKSKLLVDAAMGSLEVFKIVESNPKVRKTTDLMNHCLLNTTENSDTRILKYILADPLTNPLLRLNTRIYETFEEGITGDLTIRSYILASNMNALRILIQDPRFSLNEGHLKMALKNEDWGIIQLLLNDGRMDPTLYVNHMSRLMDDPDFDPNENAFKVSLRVGNLEVFNMIYEDERTNVDDSSLFIAASFNNQNIVVTLRKDRRIVIDTDLINNALVHASKGCAIDMIKYLLSDMRITPQENVVGTNISFGNVAIKAAIYALKEESLDTVIVLISDSRIIANEGNLLSAIKTAQVGITNLLLGYDHIVPTNEHFYAAVITRQVDIVRRLLSYSDIDPSFDSNKSILLAAGNRDEIMIKLLLKDKRTRTTETGKNELIRKIWKQRQSESKMLKLMRPAPSVSTKDEDEDEDEINKRIKRREGVETGDLPDEFHDMLQGLLGIYE